ncbi:uncharacterized protein LOC8258097 isoform X2 [Ricinus communis]|uniref:uncharacterized protein LOC8258097 isoform X2 n=1 Tax=Ricinus communis TaxID=3988 RepID=UPI000772B996|nr:uncharacterized protein LOC8258097 isoform X2 [Ricinus communis]|eukprot:XP_015574177.1 uncharacterized protein LOC8258097 isoform X2 [Ricinus communis]
MITGDLTLRSLPTENGVLREEEEEEEDQLCSGPGQIPASSPDPALISEENWERAEQATLQIVYRIHPTVEADCNRKHVVEYVQSLIQSSLGFQVFPYGSVPLKTYLPDGDIDLTAIINPAGVDASVSDVHAVLRREEQNRDAPYKVKDVHFIDAEVKLIKCIVHDIVVDISFNQLGGLSTLCFLEQVDQLIGKSHLFKRSIILIKAWCYYESRILGAHHGLISTYALETLILYIFHLFHSSLNGPLMVLYRFLDYFSKFDWDNYCISLNGPVCKSSLPKIVAEPPETGRGNLLLDDEFLRNSVKMLSVPSRSPEMNSRPFTQKHLNIVDPLRENNNLGRSVNRGNFYRIRSAFKYGARKLGHILSLQSDRMINELDKFFANTLDRHGSNSLTHVKSSCLVSPTGNFDNLSSSSLSDTSSEDSIVQKSTAGCSVRPFETSCSGNSHNASHFYLSSLHGEDGKFESGISDGTTLANFVIDGQISCTEWSESKENHFVINNSACSCSNHEERDFASISQIPRSFKSLLDLTGDYDSHLKSVKFGQGCCFFAVSAPVLPCSPTAPHSKNKNPWETVRQSLQLKRNVHSQINTNGIFGHQQHFLNHLVPFTTAFSSEEKRKQRGTGTYIPNMSYHSNRERPSSERRKNHVTANNGDLHRRTRDNGLAATRPGINSYQHGHELSEAEYPYLGNGKPVPSEVQLSQSFVWGPSSANGFSRPSERIDFGGQELQLQEASLQERVPTQDSSTSSTLVFPSSPEVTAAERREPVLQNVQERAASESYHLKDEVDFPPLSHGRAIET